MGRLFFLFVLLVSAIGYSYGFDDDEWDNYDEEESLVTYMGMTLECSWGCGEFWAGSPLKEAVAILNQVQKTVFFYSSPLYTGWGDSLPTPFPFRAWENSDSEFYVYNWQSTRGFYLPNNQREIYSLASYPEFLELATALRRDVHFYFQGVVQQKITMYRSALPLLKQAGDAKNYWHVHFDFDGELEFAPPGNHWVGPRTPQFIERLKEDISRFKKQLASDFYEEQAELVEEAIYKIDAIYRDIFTRCLEDHQTEGIVFNAALNDFLGGDFELAFQMNDYEVGKLFGHAIGKYGLDLFLAKQGTALFKAYRDLKKANQLMTLEALATPGKKQAIVTAAQKHWVLREETLKSGRLKILKDKQGKHLEGHHHYKQLRNDGHNPSVFKHSDPDRLLRDYAGTGYKERGELFKPGYLEIVDFQEFIGYSVNSTGEKTATTLGKIHYAKDGVHIVPYVGK